MNLEREGIQVISVGKRVNWCSGKGTLDNGDRETVFPVMVVKVKSNRSVVYLKVRSL